jgi:hypothetical protein
MPEIIGNQFIPYLNRYTTASPEHEAAFDEFITETTPPSGLPLRIQTKTEAFVRSQVLNSGTQPPSIILTGNAGDGKTYLCRQIIESFQPGSFTGWGNEPGWAITRDGQTLRVIKDLSELGSESGGAILRELAATIEQENPTTTFLIAANEGRLRYLLNQEQLSKLHAYVDQQLRQGTQVNDQHLIVMNLNNVTTSSYVTPALAWLTDPVHWQACQGCPAFAACPIRFNAERLRSAHIAPRLKLLYQVLEYLDIHITIRDMLIHLTYTLTGALDCQTVIERSRHLGWQTHRHVYYENVWGEEAEESFRRKVAAISYLRRLNIGGHSLFEIDDFIVNGRPADPQAHIEYGQLFAPAVDLDDRRFEQDRMAYLRGGATSPQPNEDHPLLGWLVHCRRKLFFEWGNNTQANRLAAFLFLPDYLRLLHVERGALDQAKRSLALGLNRAFSRLYINDTEHLYVTAQYARAVDQRIPIVRVKLPVDYMRLIPQSTLAPAYDYETRYLLLEIPPPPYVHSQPIQWQVDLLRFEYLMRLAEGGTYNILADECELAIRLLKDDILTRFAADEDEKRHLAFFVADRKGYTLRELWINDEGKIEV